MTNSSLLSVNDLIVLTGRLTFLPPYQPYLKIIKQIITVHIHLFIE